MAGLRGNQAYLVAAKQSGKGVEPTKWQHKTYFSGGSIAPTKATEQLSETDDTRNAGDFYVTQTSFEGTPEFYARDSIIHHWLEYVLGGAEHSGASDYTHTLKPAASIPYVTFGRMIGGTLYEQFNDGKVSELTISAGTASPLTAAASVIGRGAVRKTEEWKTELAPPSAASDAPFNYNNALVKLGGSETRLVSSFETTISNNASVQQTDDSVPYDVVEGLFSVTLGFDMIFETLAEYNKFHYGGAEGTAQNSELASTSMSFEFSLGEKNSLLFTFPKVIYQEFPVDPNPGGDPIVVSVRAAAQRHAEGFITAVVKNQVAT